MECASAQVKRWLNVARTEHDAPAAQKAFQVLKCAFEAAESGSSPPAPSELFILCCEQAISMDLWDMARECVDYFHGLMTSNRMLEARALYCEGIVQAHFIPEKLSWNEIIEERLNCASSIIRGITIAVEEWPREAWAVVHGAEKLWQVIAPLYQFGHFKSIIDIIGFVVTLHEKLMIGGGHTSIQWVTRLAVCLRGAGRIHDAVAQLNNAMESAVRINNERLQIQLLRMLTTFMADGGSSAGSKSKQNESAKFLLHQAVQVSQLFMVGQTDMHTAKQDLISVYERLVAAGNAEKEPTPPPPPTGKIKGKSKNTMPELQGDADIIQEVLSDVVLCLAFCNEGKRCEESIQKLRASINTRARTFGNYAKIMATAYESGVMEVIDSPDASYLTPAVVDVLFQSIQEIESAMDGAKMIQDGSERIYSLQVGCSLLWNFCLPLLQDETHSSLQHVLNRIVKETDECSISEPEFQVRVEYESSVAEFNEDNLSLVVRRIQKALSRGYSITHADGTVYYPMNFSLLWLLRRCEIRTAADGSEFSGSQDQAMYHLEQAELASTTAKCVAAIKTAFSKLPLLTPDTTEPPPVVVPVKEGRDANGKKTKPSELQPHHPPTLSLARLYLQLLKDCVDNLSPSLLSIAKTTAQALCTMEIAHDVKYTEFIYMKAYASLLQTKVLLMEYDSVTGAEEKKAISASLFQAFKDASSTESVLQSIGCSSAWMTINSCLLYLDHKAPVFSEGNFEAVSSELAEMYNFFISLHIDFERESSLTVDLSLMYILSLLDDYIKGKGGFPAPQPRNYDEFLEAVVRFTPKAGENKNDQSTLPLKRAQEVCLEVMQRVLLPSEKSHICRLYPAIVRLLGMKTDNIFHHPQDQLLHLVGRIAGPLSKEEKRNLITKDAWELLQQDPGVQLCGQVALYAMEIGEERLVLDICKLAETLYKDGKLGWGTMYPTVAAPLEKEKLSKQDKKEALTSTATANPKAVYPKPKYLDWFWYAKLLLFRADVLSCQCAGIAAESRESMSLTVLSFCANSAIAASHGPPDARHSQIVSAIDLFYRTLCDLWRCGCRGSKILSSLKMILSNHVLTHLQMDVADKSSNGTGTVMNHLHEIMSNLGHMMIRACALEGLFLEGMNALTAVFQVLPKKYHSSFKVQEVKFRCEMGLPVQNILHAAKAEDVETASLLWMTYAQNTGDPSKSVEVWKYAVNVLTGYPFAKANALLEMVQHVSVHGLLPTKEVKLLLLSALDLLEGFDRAVNESCVNASIPLQALMDERAKLYPNKLIATLTGRSLIMPALGLAAGSTHAATLTKNLPSVALKDVMLAIRIVFVLFSLSPIKVEKGTREDQMTRQECAMLMLHYIDCLWRLAGAVVAKEIKSQESCTIPPLELPTALGGWFGFFFLDEQIQLLRQGAAADFKHNTEGMQGIFLELCSYLLDNHMEHYCFMVYSWAIFAAGWRYGCEDIRYTLMKRTAFVCCKLAAASCGCGHQINIYNTPDLTPSQLAAVDMKLREIHLPGPLPSPTSIVFSPYIGSIQDILLRRAMVLESLGKVQESHAFLDKIQYRSSRLEDWDSYAKCILIRAKQLMIENKYRKGLEIMQKEEVGGLMEKLSPTQWLKWEQRKMEIRVCVGKASEIIDQHSQFITAATKFRCKSPSNTVGYDVSEFVFPQLVESYQDFMLTAIVRHLAMSSLFFPASEAAPLKTFLAEVCDTLGNSDSWIPKLSVLGCRYVLRLMMLENPTVDNVRWVLSSLAKESIATEELYAQISVTTTEVERALCLETTETPVRPSLCVLEAYLLFLRSENIIARLRIAQLVLDAYRGLSMEELGIPTGGPPELEKYVLDFMRDPMKKRGPGTDQEEQRTREARWRLKINDIDDETKNAFEYYNLPLELIGDVSAFDCRAALYQAKEMAGREFCAAYFSTARAITRTELRCLLESKLEVKTTSLSVEARIDELLNTQWSLCPVVAVEKAIPGKKGASEKSKKSKDPLGDWKPRIAPLDLTESEACILDLIFLVIKDAAREFNYSSLYQSYLILADFYTMWQRPQSAGTAAEFAQTAKLLWYLNELSVMMMEDTEECRAINNMRQLLINHPMLTYTSAFEEVRRSTLQASPGLSYIDFPAEWPEEAESNQPFCLPDTVTLSIVQLKSQRNYFLVVLRHPDGSVDCRRKKIKVERLKELEAEYLHLIDTKRQGILEETRKGNVRSEASVTISDLQDYLNNLYTVLRPLFEEIEESLENLAPKYSLYLCLDPILQPFPLDHLPCFSAFVTVQREISIISVKRKLEIKNTKNATVLYVVDPFGDNLSSVDAFSSEKKSSKDNHVLTSTDKVFPFSQEYLMWVLEQPTYQAVLFNMCGSLSTVLSTVAVSSIKWNHIMTVMIGADGVNEASMRREQKNELTKDSRARLFDQRWLLPLLLLLRGVRYVAMNSCPATPPANDALCKRVVPALASGKGVFEAATGRHMPTKSAKEPKKGVVDSGKKDLVVFYGVAALNAKGK